METPLTKDATNEITTAEQNIAQIGQEVMNCDKVTVVKKASLKNI